MRGRFLTVAAVLVAHLSGPASAEYEVFSLGFSSFNVEGNALAKDEDAGFELALDRPLCGPLGCLWVGVGYGHYSGKGTGIELSANRYRARLGLNLDAFQLTGGLGVAGGRYRLSQSGSTVVAGDGGAGDVGGWTAGLFGNLHLKLRGDLGLFTEGALDLREHASIGRIRYDLSVWHWRLGLSWQVPWAWSNLL